MALALSDGQTFSHTAARKNDRNILVQLKRPHALRDLFQELWREKETIETVVAHHLRRSEPSACIVQGVETWWRGQFNICILIHVHDSDGRAFKKKIFRCPVPHRVGEQNYPGTVDEKLRAEIATYAWIESNCCDIPIPCLHGFGLSSSLQFTHRAQGVGFVQDPSHCGFNRPYLLLDNVGSDKSKMLSATLKEYRKTDQNRMQNLCRGISRIMLSLASKAQPHIGSLRFNDDASITLATRPLFCAVSILESEGAPRVLNRTYATSRSFVDDMLDFREAAFRAQPNAVHDEDDCLLQMFHFTLLRYLKGSLVDCNSEGPFVLQLTDVNSSNFFVDDEWNVVGLIDLEFVCALPPSMIDMPYWLSMDYIDDVSDHIEAFSRSQKAFTEILREEEQTFTHERGVRLASSMQEAWTSDSYWFYHCLTSINAIPYCVEEHLYKKLRFSPSLEEERVVAKTMSKFWPPDSKAIVEQKLRDRAAYDNEMARHFGFVQQDDGESIMAPLSAASVTGNETL